MYTYGMTIEVDQSIKVEQTNHDTVIGISNGKQCAVMISSKIKRKLKDDFRKVGKRRSYTLRTFIAGVVLAIEHAKLTHLSKIIIDIEYPGKDRILKSIFLEMWSRHHNDIPDIRFSLIGKKSKAHEVCYLAMKKRRKVDKILTYGDIKKLVISGINKSPDA